MSQTSTQYGYPAEDGDEDVDEGPDADDPDADEEEMEEDEDMEDDMEEDDDQVVSPFVFSASVLSRVRAQAVNMNQRANLGLSLVTEDGSLNTDEIMAVLPSM